ncbi:MAG TPA: hypothetical protein VEK56_00165 [Vicinamibacterales bacterium]|nr:hypothetical protein [Vicinamibacterales bacterium]
MCATSEMYAPTWTTSARAPQPTRRRDGYAPAWRAAIGVVALAAAVGVLFIARRGRSPGAESDSPALRLTRATFDEGVTADPAVSNDGVLLAYASDRAGADNLDIWVQQTAGSTPLQLTHDFADEREPAFSPDGSRIAFRSERDGGGGVYIIPTLGGG